MTASSADRLYELLPVVYRQRDAERGWPLEALLRVLAEQVDLVEEDIDRLYENWFIETCDDWVVPYIGDLLGYQPVHEAGEPADPSTAAGRRLNKILIPRREVANTVRYRRRKGTLALLEELARDVAGWPTRAVEFARLVSQTRTVRLPQAGLDGGWGEAEISADLRRAGLLDLLDGPFDRLPHTVDVRRVNSSHASGRYNLPNVALFVWRLKAQPVSRAPAKCLDKERNWYTFSVLGNDQPVFQRSTPEADPSTIAGEANLPVAIRRRRLADGTTELYGAGGSLAIWDRPPFGTPRPEPIPVDRIVAADLSQWRRPPAPAPGSEPAARPVAVDPELGRILFPTSPRQGVWVSYHRGFAAELGGGGYPRIQAPAGGERYTVGDGGDFETILAAVRRWRQELPAEAVIEIVDSGDYDEPLTEETKGRTARPLLDLGEGRRLELRAADGCRPSMRVLDEQANRPDDLWIRGGPGSRFGLDGLLVSGRGLFVEGGLEELAIRHSTLVPGWSLSHDSRPENVTGVSVELMRTGARVLIDHSIVGTLRVTADEVATDPIEIQLRDSVLDATGPERWALTGPELEAAPGSGGGRHAHAVVSLIRCTVIGRVRAHAVELGENSLFIGRLEVARQQRGCVRFCYLTPGSRTPRRYRCQPQLAQRRAVEELEEPEPTAATREAARELARLRVQPRLKSARFGTPVYCQLADSCPEEIVRGADDRSEMGVFHDLFQPQRAANLAARLEEYTPAGLDVGPIYVS